MLLVEIDRHTRHGRDCFMSNKYIADFIGVAEANASRILNSLIEKGYVEKTRFDGRRRFVASTVKTSFGNQPRVDAGGGVRVDDSVKSELTKTSTILVNEINSNEINSNEIISNKNKNKNKNNSARAREKERDRIISDIEGENSQWIETMMMHLGIEREHVLELAKWSYDQIALNGNTPSRGDVMRYSKSKAGDFSEYRRTQSLKEKPLKERQLELWNKSRAFSDDFSYTLRYEWACYYGRPSNKDPDLMKAEEYPNFDVLTSLKKWKLNNERDRKQQNAI